MSNHDPTDRLIEALRTLNDPEQPQRVTVVDIDVSFMQMVFLLLKFAIALIPAAVILTVAVLGTVYLLSKGIPPALNQP